MHTSLPFRARSAAAVASLVLAGLASACAPGTPAGPPLTGTSQPTLLAQGAQVLACKLTPGSFSFLVTDVVNNDKVSYIVFPAANGTAGSIDSGVATEDVPTAGAVLPAGCYAITMSSIGTNGSFRYRISW